MDKKSVFAASAPLLLIFSLGMISGYSATLLPQLRESANFKLDEETESWIASSAALSMTIGCVFGAGLIEWIGRKSSQIITVFLMLVGWTTIFFSYDIRTLLVGRFLGGLGAGILLPSAGVYISETSETRSRSVLLGVLSFAMSAGLFFVHLIGTLTTWRNTCIVSCLVPIISSIILTMIPESPAWLIKSGRIDKAFEAFHWCHGYSEEARIDLELLIERHSNSQTRTELKDLLSPIFLKPLAIVIVYMMMVQWTGIGTLTFYSVGIMKKTVGNGFNEYVAMLIVDIIRVIVSTITCLLMKRYGRRPLSLTSGIGTFFSLLILSMYTHLSHIYDLSSYSAIPILTFIAYISSLSIGFIPIPLALMGELFPLSLRSIGNGFSSFMAFLSFFTVIKTAPALFSYCGMDGTYLIYSGAAIGGTLFAHVFLPETKDKTLEQIEEYFKNTKQEHPNEQTPLLASIQSTD